MSSAAIHGKGEKPLGAAAGSGTAEAGGGAVVAGAVRAAGLRRVGRLAIGSIAACCDGCAGRSAATCRVEAGRLATDVAGGAVSRTVVAGDWSAGCSSARRVTVPLRLKFESSLGPMLLADAGGGVVEAALSCASKGQPASSNPAARPERQTKTLTLLAKFESRCKTRSGLWPASRPASRLRASGGVHQHQFRVVLRLDAQAFLAANGNSIARTGSDTVHPDSPARHQIEVALGVGRELDRAASFH